MQRLMTRILEAIGEKKWGVRPKLMAHIVSTLGAGGAARWFVANLPRYERTLGKLGPIRTHLLCVEISVTNGCEYCTFAHGLALELHVYRANGGLFPLDEHQLAALHRVPVETRTAALSAALEAAALPDTVEDFRRMRAVAGGAPARDKLDRRIAHLVRMFATLNSCAMRSNVGADEAHDAINKDKELIGCYRAARSAAAVR
jgi:hypothetical protein